MSNQFRSFFWFQFLMKRLNFKIKKTKKTMKPQKKYLFISIWPFYLFVFVHYIFVVNEFPNHFFCFSPCLNIGHKYLFFVLNFPNHLLDVNLIVLILHIYVGCSIKIGVLFSSQFLLFFCNLYFWQKFCKQICCKNYLRRKKNSVITWKHFATNLVQKNFARICSV